MQISINSTIQTAWRLPLSHSELTLSLEVMGEVMDSSLPGNSLLELTLLSEREIAELNEHYLHCTGPTNILAFPAGENFLQPAPEQTSLGWLALSPFTLRREALLYKQNTELYTLRMLAHGLAHLLGYEHGERMDAAGHKAALAAQLALATQMGIDTQMGMEFKREL
jgi:probable rRNA maturation factor